MQLRNYCMFCTTVKLSIDAAPQYNGLNPLNTELNPICQ